MDVAALQASRSCIVKVRLRRVIALRRGALELADNVAQEEVV